MNDAEKIKELIKQYNTSQNGFAKMTQVAQSYISYILNGKTPLSENVAKKIIRNLGLPENYFGDFKEEIKEKPKEEIIEIPKKETNENAGYEDIIEIVEKITSLRAQLLSKIKFDREKDKIYNGIDQDFLHGIENLEKLSDKEAIDMVLKEREARKNRRVVKNRIFVIQNVLEKMPLVDYKTFVLNGLEQGKNYEYKPRVQSAK